MRKHTEEFYEGIVADALQLSCKPTLRGKVLSDDIKDGIDTTLKAIEITESELEILTLKYDALMSNKEIAELKGVTPQKIASQINNICARIRTSSKMMHFLRGQHEGEINELYAKSLFNSQKNLKDSGVYADFSKEIRAFDLRYLALLGLSENQLLLLYKEGYRDIGNLADSMDSDMAKLKKRLGSDSFKKLAAEFKELGLIKESEAEDV